MTPPDANHIKKANVKATCRPIIITIKAIIDGPRPLPRSSIRVNALKTLPLAL